MASVRLSDIIDVQVFQDLPAVNSPEKTALFQSGIVVNSPLLDNIATADGRTAELPFWNDLDQSVEPNYSSDDPASKATPQKVAQGEQKTRKAFMNQGWSATDLAMEVAMGANAMEHIRSRVDMYWTRRWQRRLVQSTLGVLNDNVANDSGDMVNDIAIEDGNNAAASNLLSRSAFTAAAFTLGDAFENTGIVIMHSVVYKRAVDNDDIDFIRDSTGTLEIPTYMGKRVVVDDGAPTIAGVTSGFKYVTILCGPGAFGYGNGAPQVPVEIWRDPQAGDGGGEEQLWTRKTWIVHPFGFQFTDTTLSGNAGSPTNADLALAVNWDRVVDRKNVPLAFLITNG